MITSAPSRLRATLVCDDAVAVLAGSGHAVAHVTSGALRVRTRAGLVTLLAAGSGAVPRGIGLAAPGDFRSWGLSAGDPVVRSGARVLLGQGAASVEVDGALHVSSVLPVARRSDPGPTALRAAAEVAGEAPAARGLVGLLRDARDDPAPASALALAAARRAVPALRSALAARAPERAAAAARPLLGLGEGLTPSGDDVLVGMIAALRAWRRPEASFARRCAAEAPARTTAVSADLLAHAAEGRFAAVLHAVLGGLDDDDGPATRQACRDLLAVGATSGADLLTGVLLGARTLSRPGARPRPRPRDVAVS